MGGTLLFTRLALKLKEGGDLYYGEGSGFWSVTTESLMKFGFYPWSGPENYIVPIALVISFVAGCAFFVRSKDRLGNYEEAVGLMLIGGLTLGLVVLRHMVGINYPKDRVAIYFIPLTIIVIVSVRKLFPQTTTWKALGILLVMTTWLFPFNLIATVNLSYTRIWKWESGSREFFNRLEKVQENTGVQPIVSGSTLQTHSYNYYNMRAHWPLSAMQDHISGSDIPDYQYSYPEGSGNWWRYDTLCLAASDSSALLVRKPNRERQWIETLTTTSWSGLDEFFPFAGYALEDSLQNQDLLFELTTSIQVDEADTELWIVLDVIGKEGNGVLYRTYKLNERIAIPQEEKRSSTLHWVMPGSFTKADFVKIYVWNIHQRHVDVQSSELKIYRLVP